MPGTRCSLVASALCLLVLFVPRPIYACSCGAPPVCEAFWAADAVFVGVADVIAEQETRTRFRVEEAFRGVRQDEMVEVASYGVGWSCEYGFRHGTRYLVFANKRQTGGWRAGLCSRTKPLDEASHDLGFARTASRETTAPGRVYGTAWIVDEGPLLEPATVSLKGSGYAASKSTRDRGQFEFDRVPPGRYRLSIVRSGILATPPVTIEVNGPGACVRHIFNLSRQSPRTRREDEVWNSPRPVFHKRP